jgi:hypothetical protein
MSLYAGNVISVPWRRTSKKYKLNFNIYGKKENNIRQFYTWYHRMYIGGRDINACGTAKRCVITFLHCMVDCLHALSAG